MQRISIVGSSGSGKSTLARQMGERLGLPVVHVDTLYWSAGWKKPEDLEAFRQRLAAAAAQERWIIEGNYSSHFDLRLPRTDTIILLERSRWLCFWRALKRWWRWRGRTRPDLPDGCPESIDLAFYKWILWDFPQHSLPATRDGIATLGRTARLIVLKSDQETAAFLTDLRG